jgi:hypothetical protein
MSDSDRPPGGPPNPAGGIGSRQGITFDRFVRACVVIKSLTEGFQKADAQRQGYMILWCTYYLL